ncbi:MAG TPA: protein-disulfide reductase DsbD domain-containing protein [Hyphomonadaceae bacterium]|nr:protein-disulfide reductase DsbD domain-containing protein [Hyphomonadaceae bacterium]
MASDAALSALGLTGGGMHSFQNTAQDTARGIRGIGVGCVSLAAAALLGLALHGAAQAQAPGGADVVSWTASAQSADNVKAGSRIDVTLRGVLEDGWHVYGLEQPKTGPIPLRVTVDQGDVAAADGALAASAPEKIYDPSFKLETLSYSKPFTLTAPVRISPEAPSGSQQIAVSVRFQTCNGKTCHPPKTVRLSVPINVRKAD